MADRGKRPDIEHLKKQAKDLLRLYRAQDPEAFRRFRESLPAARARDDAGLSAMQLKLHDAQSCLARERGFTSWANLKAFVEWRNSSDSDAMRATRAWVRTIYGDPRRARQPELAAKMLSDRPELPGSDPVLPCAIGDEKAVRQALEADPAFPNRTMFEPPPGNLPPEMPKPPPGAAERFLFWPRPPLWALANSSFLAIPEFRERMHRCARLLLDAGADPNQSWTNHDGHPLSALYGAAGLNHDPVLTKMLLEAGANPNDGESLYHSMETDDLTCTELLLEAGARVEGNELHHMLDTDRLDGLKLVLRYVQDASDIRGSIGPPLLWAIRRRRSVEHIRALLEAGADPNVRRDDGQSAYRLAALYGLHDVAELLAEHGAAEALSVEERFVAACARADRDEAEAIVAERPGIIGELDETTLRQLPELTENGAHDAVRLMVELGWPIATRGGDWSASALNLAVFQGNAGLTRFLLEHGASWTEEHGYGDNARGTLSWASRNRPSETGDWPGCARALVEHGMEIPEVEGHFSEEVEAFFAQAREPGGGQ